ncbi:MAG: biotin transporter BioY [Pseudomonadota bacterium]
MQLSSASTIAPLQKWASENILLRSFMLVLAGSGILAASAWIEVPMIPVPMTMQSFAILLIGAFYGSRLAFATVVAYLFEGAIGLPVFSGGAGGAHHLIGPTAGYLAAFPFAAAFVGLAVERRWLQNIYASFGAMIVSHAIVFAGGVAWLSYLFGMETAITTGLTPFIIGSLVKSGLAVAVLQLSQTRK